MFSLNYEAYLSGGGTLGENAFERFGRRALCVIERATRGRLRADAEEGLPERAVLCAYDLAELFAQAHDRLGLRSASNDGVSVAYDSDTRAEAGRLLREWLGAMTLPDGTSALYAGD